VTCIYIFDKASVTDGPFAKNGRRSIGRPKAWGQSRGLYYAVSIQVNNAVALQVYSAAIHALVHILSIPDPGGLTQVRIATRAEIAHLQFRL
jgi:hypothetical protein